jgi:hypothetical protein
MTRKLPIIGAAGSSRRTANDNRVRWDGTSERADGIDAAGDLVSADQPNRLPGLNTILASLKRRNPGESI